MIFSLLLWFHTIAAPVPDTLHAAANTPTQTREIRTPIRKTSVRNFAATQTQLPWNGHFSAKNFSANPNDRLELFEIRKNLRTVFLALPKTHTANLQDLEIRNEKNVSRGLGNGRKIILNTDSIDDADELISVFVHELGHAVDLGVLKSGGGKHSKFYDNGWPVFENDPSVKFYEISWATAKTRKRGSERTDFVSGYAMYDCFEDFAETYNFYRMHGEKFRKAKKSSAPLRAKYNFMKTVVFDGVEFQTEKSGEKFVHGIIFDTTLLSIDDLENFEILARR
ncbi:hypothetical protein HN954_01665 [bacterium]|jgi:hypothetical protein|nr:hypothetical protein [bacterium]MBT6831972.1 hypothetical protein [bacterium]MBT6996117.1 hypothetical protein [bacterium]MBT7772652.1 hypothetical protein [bacterium]